MFGNIIGFDKNKLIVTNAKGIADTNYIGYHTVFPEVDHKIVGEIVGIDTKTITINLIGEITNGVFTNGVLKKPSVNTIPRIIFKSVDKLLFGNLSKEYADEKNMCTYDGTFCL